jgi:hypothetical protein
MEDKGKVAFYAAFPLASCAPSCLAVNGDTVSLFFDNITQYFVGFGTPLPAQLHHPGGRCCS